MNRDDVIRRLREMRVASGSTAELAVCATADNLARYHNLDPESALLACIAAILSNASVAREYARRILDARGLAITGANRIEKVTMNAIGALEERGVPRDAARHLAVLLLDGVLTEARRAGCSSDEQFEAAKRFVDHLTKAAW